MDESRLDAGDAPVPAQLGDESTARFERAPNSADNEVWLAHPMKRRVAEHRIEFSTEVEPLGVHDARVQTELECSLDLRGTGIDTDDGASVRGQSRAQHAVAASEIQN